MKQTDTKQAINELYLYNISSYNNSAKLVSEEHIFDTYVLWSKNERTEITKCGESDSGGVHYAINQARILNSVKKIIAQKIDLFYQICDI